MDGPDGPEGTRIPDHPTALQLLREVAEPLAVTSANQSGDSPALTAEAAANALGDDVRVVIDAGPSKGQVPSTVVRVWEREYEVLREGALSGDKIGSALAENA